MTLRFDFQDYSRLTFYGNDVTGIRSEDGQVKAFIADDSVALYDKKLSRLVSPAGASFNFQFKPKILLDSDFCIDLDFDIEKAFSFPLLTGDNFKMIIHPDSLEIIIEKLIYTIPFGITLTDGRYHLSIFREDDQVWVEIEGEQYIIQSSAVKGILDVSTFLGNEIRPSQLAFYSFSISDELESFDEELPEEMLPEEMPVDDLPDLEPVEIPTEEVPEEIAEAPIDVEPELLPEELPEGMVMEEIPEELIEVDEQTIKEPITQRPMKELTELEKLIVSGYAGLLEASKGTKVGKYYKTVEELQEAASENKTFLVKVIYYILISQPEWADQPHEAVKVRAYELFELFGKDSSGDTKRYGFMEGVTYKSFKYGELTDEDLTDELLVELLMEEYEGVRGLIIKK